MVLLSRRERHGRLQVVVPALGHTPGEAVRENEIGATCTAEGSYDEVVYCSVCKAELSRTKKTIEKTAHTLTKCDAKAATCTEAGTIEYWTCSLCEKLFSDAEGTTEITADEIVIPAPGHDWGEWVTNEAGDEETRTCNRCSETETRDSEYIPSNIESNTVDFNGKLFLITYIKLSDDVMADANAYVSVTFNGKTTTHNVAGLKRDGQGRVSVRQELFAAMMRDEMTLQVFNGQGEVQTLMYKETEDVTDGFVYSALKYLKDRQENSKNEEMKELARAAELYGTAVQVYFGYKTDELPPEDRAAMEEAANEISIPESCAEDTTGTLLDGVKKRTKTVMFESDNTLRQYYYIDDESIGNYTFTLNDDTVEPERAESGKYYVDQPNIASGLLSREYTFTVSDGTNTFTITSSALGYAYDCQYSGTQNMVNLVKLLYRYSQAADAYFDGSN